jgi:hypothetical protein
MSDTSQSIIHPGLAAPAHRDASDPPPDSSLVCLDVSTKLMENYRSVVPATGGGALSVIATNSGPLIAGISSTSRGYVLVQDPTSDSGWRSLSLGSTTVKQVVAVLDAAGMPHVFASDGSSLLHAWQNGTDPVAWSQLVPVPLVDAPGPIAVLNYGGRAHVVAAGSSAVSYGADSSAAPGSFEWFPGVIGLDSAAGNLQSLHLLPDRNDGVLVAPTYAQGIVVQIQLYRGSAASWSHVSNAAPLNWAPTQVNGIVNGDDVAVFSATVALLAWHQSTPDAQWEDAGYGIPTAAFALTAFKPWLDRATGRVSGLVLGSPAATLPQGGDTPFYAESLTSPISIQQWNLTSLADGESAVVARSQKSFYVPDTSFATLADPVAGRMRGFAIDRNGQLSVLEQQESGWSPLLPLGHVATALYPVNHPDGYSQVVATEAAGIYVLSYSNETSEWTREDVEVVLPTEAEQYNCYSTEITIKDANDVPRPRVNALIKSSDPVEARINGRAAFLDPEKPVAIVANFAGRITIEIATALDCTELLVQADGMEADSWVSIVPQIEVQAKLKDATTSGANLLAQKDRFGNNVVTGPVRVQPAQADHVARAIQKCCELVETAGTHLSPTSGPLRNNRFPARVRYMPPGETRSGRFLNLAAVEPASWSIDFTSGSPVFNILSDEEAAAATNEFGLFGVDWGDVWGSIKNGVSELGRFAVRIIVDPVTQAVTAIEASVTALIEGVCRAFKATIDLVEQVFDVIQGIFAAIKTFIQELIDWLAFFFDWDDIKLSKHAVKYLLEQYGALCDGMLARSQTQINSVLLGAAADVTSWADQIGASLGSRSALTMKAQDPPPDYITDGGAHNIVQSNLFDALSSGEFSVSSTIGTTDVTAAAGSLVSLIEQFAQEMIANAAYAPAAKYFESIVSKLQSDPDAFLETALSGMVEALASLAAAGLRTLASFVDRLIGLLRQVIRGFTGLLDAELDIPIISPLYKLLTGDTLTFGDVIALAAGVAITLSYKIAYGRAPFTKGPSGSLAAFKTNWSAANLLALAAGTATHAFDTASRISNRAIGNTVLIVCTIGGGICDAIADSQAASEAEGSHISVITAAFDSVTVFLNFPWASSVTDPIDGAPGVDSVDGLFATSWLLDVMTTSIDIGYIAATKKHHKLTFEKYGPVATTVIGVLQYAIYSGIIAIQVKEDQWGKTEQEIDIGSMLVYFPVVIKSILRSKNPFALAALLTSDIVGPLIGGMVILTANVNPQFSLTVSPTSVSAATSTNATATVSSKVSGGFDSAVSLSTSGLPTGASASFSPESFAAPGAGSSALTIATGKSVAGTYNLTITGTSNKNETAQLALTITSDGGGKQV